MEGNYQCSLFLVNSCNSQLLCTRLLSRTINQLFPPTLRTTNRRKQEINKIDLKPALCVDGNLVKLENLIIYSEVVPSRLQPDELPLTLSSICKSWLLERLPAWRIHYVKLLVKLCWVSSNVCNVCIHTTTTPTIITISSVRCHAHNNKIGKSGRI